MKKTLKTLIVCLLFLLIGCKENNKQISITFQTNGGSSIQTITTIANKQIDLPQPTKDGYKFVNYYDLDGNTYTDKAQFANDITLYANWNLEEYTVKFFDFDNSLISEQIIKYKKSAIKPNDPSRENYVFIGWDKEFNNIKSDLNIYAQYEEATEGLVYQLEQNGYVIIDYNGNNNEVIIPSFYKGYQVIAIANEAFQQKAITKITLPDTITIIGYRAFFDCISLETINIPTSVLSIEEEAFMNCTSIAAITLPTPVIGKAAFYNCSALSNISILDSVTTILDAAFYNCSRLITLYIPDSVTTIGANVISWCQNLEYIYTTAANVSNLEKMFNTAGYIYSKKVKFAAK